MCVLGGRRWSLVQYASENLGGTFQGVLKKHILHLPTNGRKECFVVIQPNTPVWSYLQSC